MPEILDLKELEAKAKKKAIDEAPEVERVVIDGVAYWKLKDGRGFKSYGEAMDVFQDEKVKKDYKSRGLNELGQTPEQAAKSVKLKALREERGKLIDKISGIDVKIGSIISGADEEGTKKKK